MSAIKDFVDFSRELVERLTENRTIAIKEGRDYYRVLTVIKKTNKAVGVLFFVEIETGEIYGPKTSRKPALEREFGNINETDSYQKIGDRSILEVVSL